MRTDGYTALMEEVRMSDFGDPYGAVSGWLFAIGEAMYVIHGQTMPEFRPSPLLRAFRRDCKWFRGHVDESWELSTVVDLIDGGAVSPADLRAVWCVLSRYDEWVRLAGRNY